MGITRIMGPSSGPWRMSTTRARRRDGKKIEKIRGLNVVNNRSQVETEVSVQLRSSATLRPRAAAPADESLRAPKFTHRR